MKYILSILMIVVNGCGHNTNLLNTFSASMIKTVNQRYVQSKVYYGIDIYRIQYDTQDINGKRIIASGIIIIPRIDDVLIDDTALDKKTIKSDIDNLKEHSFSILIYNHGTITSNRFAPSNIAKDKKFATDPRSYYSSLARAITLMPDYIGYGSSKNSIHPYMIKDIQGKSIVDFYKAAVNFIQSKHLAKLNGKLYITGYSEGGYATLAALNVFEESGISVNMAVAMDGPYRLDYLADIFSHNRNFQTHVNGVAYTIYTYSKVYRYDLADIINPNYISVIEEIFKGNKYNSSEAKKKLPDKLVGYDGLLQNSFIDNLKNSDFYDKLKENSINKTFITPIKLIHCKGDDVVPYKIALKEYEVLVSSGSKVELITVENRLNMKKRLSHAMCFYPALYLSTITMTRGKKQ